MISLVAPHEVIFVSGKQTQWLDYLPSPVLALAASGSFCAVAMQDGLLNVYSPTGRRYDADFFESGSVLIFAWQVDADPEPRRVMLSAQC